MWPLRTVANLLGALREGDFSTRLRGDQQDDALGELMFEANALAGLLYRQRLEALEASGLRDAVMAEIEVAILVFDPQSRLVLANRAAESLLGATAGSLLGATAAELELEDFLDGERSRTFSRDFPAAAAASPSAGRWCAPAASRIRSWRSPTCRARCAPRKARPGNG